MKGLYLALAVTLASVVLTTARGEGLLTRDLEAKLEASSQVELIPINIALKRQLERSRLESLLVDKTRRERREIVVRELKAFTERDQAQVLGYLRRMELLGEVRAVRSLWVNNVVCCKAIGRVIRGVALLPGIRSIDWDERRQVLAGFTPKGIHPEAKGPYPKGGAKSQAWGVVKIRAPEVWALGNTGQGILVSVHDTGVDYNHTDLQDHMWDGGPSYPNHGWDFAYDDDDPMDGHGHGTHCAGTIAGDGTAGCSTGVAPDAIVMALKVLDDEGMGVESDVWESIQFAIDNGVDVMSFSIGWVHLVHNPDRATWRTTFENALSAGLIAAAAAGNERLYPRMPAPDNVRTPGDVPPPWLHPDQTLLGGLGDIVTCGATDSSDAIATFSSYGPVSWETISPWFDYPYQPEMGLIDPDVAAPGVNVTSCWVGGGYMDGSGTSMATPHVAGTMCLVLTAHAGWLPGNVDEALELTAVDLGFPGKDNDYGAGRIDAYEAVSYGGATGPNIYLIRYAVDDPPPGNQNGVIDPGETVDLTVTLRNIGLDATNVEGIFREWDPYLSVSDSLSNFGAIMEGDTATNSSDPYVLTADPSTPSGWSAACALHLTADGGYEVDRPLTLTVGDPTVGPGGPDDYGYYCYDDRDVAYTECPTYAWFEIAPPGPGVVITEISNQDDAWTTRTLPFTFKYYGVDQTLISICSNGWISMGVAGSADSLNSPIPDPDGPSGMIAPFWDNLDPEAFGDVYEYYDTTGHRYIIEWKEVAHFFLSDFRETFQVVLYDAAYETTITGDGEIICQYETVTIPFICAVGIEDYSETDGIQYLYRGTYDIHASPLQAERAIKFTTDPPVPVGLEEQASGIWHPASGVCLFQNFPNPFTRATTITYSVPSAVGGPRTAVSMSVYDVAGRLVRTLVDGEQEPGLYRVQWDGGESSGLEAAGGVYFVRLSCIGGRANDVTRTKSIVMLR